ncbi:MAG: hypothetical protein ACFE96_00295 [Candidatus Hermodarchaeota archaeon]
MKSKNFIIGLISLSLIIVTSMTTSVTSDRPQTQAIGDFSLGLEIGDYFEFVCTEYDTTELNNVFGGDWLSDLDSYFWFADYFAPTSLGEKSKIAIVNITDHPTQIDWWRFTLDGWGWIDKSTPFGSTPVRDDTSYNLPFDPTEGTFNPSVWLIAIPVIECISNFSYNLGYSYYDNVIEYTSTDVLDYEVNWIYDESTGVVKNFRIKNNVGTTIFEVWGFELKLETQETYNWIVTELDDAELESVFGVNWEVSINSFCWWALDGPTVIGNKSKFMADTIANHPTWDDWYQFQIDGWSWIDSEMYYATLPDRDDVTYNLPMDPEGLTFHYSLFIIPTPVVTYLEVLSYDPEYSASDNAVTLSSTADEDFEAFWLYDENLGVTELFQIKNSNGDVIFEVCLLEFKLPEDTEFTWQVVTLNEARLEDIFGGNWESDLQGLFGNDCNETGAQLRRTVLEYDLYGDLWYVNFDQWSWTTSTFASEPDMTSSYGLYSNPQDGYWGPWMWLVPLPAHYYLVGRQYGVDSELSDLTVTIDSTDIEDYKLICIYDDILGVLKIVQLRDDSNQLVFDYRLTSAIVPDDGIPGYNLYIFVSTLTLLTGFISILLIKKIRRK